MIRLKGNRKQINVSVETHKLLKFLAFRTEIPMQVLADEMIGKILRDEKATAETVRRIRDRYKIVNQSNG